MTLQARRWVEGCAATVSRLVLDLFLQRKSGQSSCLRQTSISAYQIAPISYVARLPSPFGLWLELGWWAGPASSEGKGAGGSSTEGKGYQATGGCVKEDVGVET